jgi:diguanylate cyclase (GGDEF)-like protein
VTSLNLNQPAEERQELAERILGENPELPHSIQQIGGRAVHYLAVILENLGAGALLIEGSERNLVLTNPELAAMVGLTEEQVLALTRTQLVERFASLSDEPEIVRKALVPIPDSAPYAADDGFTLARPTRRVISWRARPVRLPTGIGQLCLFRDVTSEFDANEQLKRSAHTDPLTGLPNRRAAVDFLEREAARSDRTQQPLCVALFDIDHFKQINDTLGHSVGDDVLCQVSKAFSHCMRRTDLTARWGGEEFLSVLVDCETEGAEVLAHRFREVVRGLPFRVGTQPITLSVGIARYRPNESRPHLLKRVDAMLYEAKRNGRDRAVVEVATKEAGS